MAIGGRAVELDPERDTLVNVNALGDPVPSARFMGGREFERLMENHARTFAQGDIEAVLRRELMLFPAVESRSGPFKGRSHAWSVDEASLTDGERFVAVSFYLALMTATGLDITGAEGEIRVEGPFAENTLFLDMLASATGRPVSAVAGTGTSIGAALLTTEVAPSAAADKASRSGRADMAAYARRWRVHLAG